MKNKKGIDKVFTEKERYALLRQAGYSVKDAQKMRRYGASKFFENLQQKEEKSEIYLKAKEKYKETEQKIRGFNFISYETKKADFNYTLKYNYIVNVKLREKDTKKIRSDYFTYSTNKKKTDFELEKEVKEILQTYNIKYNVKVIDYDVETLAIKE